MAFSFLAGHGCKVGVQFYPGEDSASIVFGGQHLQEAEQPARSMRSPLPPGARAPSTAPTLFELEQVCCGYLPVPLRKHLPHLKWRRKIAVITPEAGAFLSRCRFRAILLDLARL